ncbi:MAG: Ig-like domain-containing protein [Bacteroidota bacterium]
MKKVYLSLLLNLLCIAAFALNGPSTPVGPGTGFSGTTAFCQGATATATTYNYTECSVGTGAPTGVACVATWYYNPTNTTVLSGSTVTISSTPFTSEAGTDGDLPTVTPVTTSVGNYYYFCRVTWTDPGTCTSPFVTATRFVRVNANPSAITGTASVCEGSTTLLSNATSGGMSWTSSAPSTATVGSSSGVVTGVAAGNATITYTLTTGCYSTRQVTVNAIPATITGTASVCAASTTTLASATGGGTWAASNVSIASVGTSSGVVTGVNAGTATITYTAAGCRTTRIVTVNGIAAIGGTAVVCVAATTTLTNTTSGGTWSSSDASLATVGSSTGVVTGVAAGNPVITYTSAAGCVRTKVVTVNPQPAAIGGTLTACPGTTTTLTNATSGGAWSGSNSAIATINSATGVLTGANAGTLNITYSLTSTTGCKITAVATINSLPATIAGGTTVCIGLATTLTNASPGGTWESSNTTNATIGSSDGIVSGLVAGTTTITYTLPTGCRRTMTMTVKPLPSAISGTLTVCVGSTILLTNATTGGVSWTSSDPANATVGSSNGIVTGVAAGTTNITYTLNTGCYTVSQVTVNALPASITGTASVCIGSTTSLDNATAGGTWSSSNANATIGSATGVVTGVTAGTATITYVLSTGCRATRVVTVNSLPAVITGSTTVCVSTTSTLADATAGGTWSTSDAAVATIGSTTGIVSGVAPGNATMTYTLPTGCYRTASITVIATPAAITGTGSVCISSTTTLADATAGGTWLSSNPAIASIGSATGIVTGVAAGNATISYIYTAGCQVTTVVTVNSLPAAITGTTTVCAGSVTTLSDATGGGTWSVSNASIATIGSADGIVTGVAAGTATATYTITATGCYRTAMVSVNPLPGTIGGATEICVSSTGTLTTTGSGHWTSSNTSVATINLISGMMTGISAGNATITFVLPSGCRTTTVITVNALPAAITGTKSICATLTTTLASATGGGTWGSSNTGVATVDAAGEVTGVSAGTSAITYTVATGCYVTAVVTVVTTPAAITGTASVCAGLTTTLTSASTGGTWTSSDGAIATIGSATGIVTGVASGNADISYSLGGSCVTVREVTVNTTPAIGGTLTVCAGLTSALTNAASGGTWVSSNTAAATIGSNSGIVTAVTAGTSTITYSPPSAGCKVYAVVTVEALPATITGTSSVCIGLTTTLADATAGGTWTSSNTGNATIGSASGIVTGVAAGTSTITYMLGTGCYRTRVQTVNPLPAAIGGSTTVCMGNSAALTNATSGGMAWSSGDVAVATVGSSSGVVTPVSVGTATITYTLTTGCYTTTIITVNSTPGAITGTTTVCAGATTSLDNPSAGGTWASSNAVIASVGSSSGVVTGVVGGTATITYTLGAGSVCRATTIVTVYPNTAITGTAIVCAGSNTTLANATAGGAWSSSDAGIATVGTADGIVAGVSAGNATITYTTTNGCISVRPVTVNPLPAVITGTGAVCAGLTTTLANATAGGTWTVSDDAFATVGSSTGIVTGVAGGNPDITYTLPTGCVRVRTITVNPLPSGITGGTSVCVGATITLANLASGGTWSSSTPARATIDVNDGYVTGVSAGTTTITYTITATGCIRTITMTVNALPAAIGGTLSVCIGSTTNLTNATSGGAAWTSSNGSVATVGSSSGVVTGVAAGNADITYTLTTGCYSTANVTVNALPAVITGTASVCAGLVTTLANATAGGTWQSSTTSVATIGSADGDVTGVTAGTSTISYTLTGTGCRRTTVVTVNALPAAITGTALTCVAGTTTLANASSGGTWSSSDITKATIGSADGVVTGVATGNSTITYTLPTGCLITRAVTVIATPAAITGTASVCVGATTTLANATAGGTWSSSATGTATVGSATGIVTGVSAGNADITYSIGSGCVSTQEVTVNSLPAAITGTGTVCVGATTSLDNATAGGSWSSSNAAVASVGTATGVVTGVASGTATITYLLATGCRSTTVVSVNPIAAITGTKSTCVASTTTLANATPGGAWTSSDAGVATIGSANGVVTGVSDGTTTITYTISATGCFATAVATVNPAPGAITGTTTVCAGTSSSLGNAVPGGTWSGSNAGVLTVNASTGVVTGNTVGTATVTYSTGTSCRSTTVVSVIAAPANIGGTLNACVGLTSTLTNATAGGTWTSSNTGNATVGSSDGVVTGVTAGTTTITYTTSNGCFKTATFTVKALPSAINGTLSVCIGSTTLLSNATSGGVSWTSSATGVATVGAGSGVVTGVSAGNATITYLINTGCYITAQVTVNPLPAAITGTATVCAGSTTTLANADAGGTWTSSNTTFATIGSADGIVTGNVVGVSTGTSNITYTLSTGCRRTTVVTVYPVAAIAGTASVCEGLTVTLTNPVSGGTWSSSATGTATVGSATGVVTGVAAGNADISYTTTGGCVSTRTATVNVTPAAITGSTSACVGLTSSLANATAGGSWTVSSSAIASIGTATGVVTGVAAGTVTVTYSMATGCRNTTVFTVNAIPASIGGTNTVCAGSTTTLTNATAGGTWSSSNLANATIGVADGIVTGVAAGTSTITYSITATGCIRTTTAIVNPLPAAITGTQTACVGYTTVLFNASSGGAAWTSSTPAVATIGSVSGVVTGVTVGTSTVTYTLATGCRTTAVVTVNATPAAITGTFTACANGSTTLANATAGGAWSSSNATVATVGTGDGIVAGASEAGGITTISYTIPATGCFAIATVTINTISAIGGTAQVCASGGTTTLTNLATGGTWASSDVTKATIGSSSGIVTGLMAGNSTITFTSDASCTMTRILTVNPLPAVIGGASTVCVGATTTLTNADAGGTWASSNTGVATIGSSDGDVEGIAYGLVTITYTLPTGCTATKAMTVETYPGIIDGPATVEEGDDIILTNDVAGGVWSRTNIDGDASIAPDGTVTGITQGNVTISYAVTTGCGTSYATVNVTVVPVGGRPGGNTASATGTGIDVRIVPNPNNGAFTITGSLGSAVDAKAAIEITNMLGQVVYTTDVTAGNGAIKQIVTLSNTLANGMYLLTVRSGADKKVIHFVIEQ